MGNKPIDIVIFSTGGHAREMHDLVLAINKQEPVFNFIGFLDQSNNSQIYGAEQILDNHTWLRDNPSVHVVIAIGSSASRCRVSKLIRSVCKNEFQTLIHPTANIGEHCEIGAGVKANFASLLRVVRLGVPLPLGLARHNRRSFVSLNNLVNFIITCISHRNAANQTFLVSDNEDVSTADLLRRMAAAQGVPARLIPVPLCVLKLGAKLLGKTDVAQRLLGSLQVDITKNQVLLGWKPPISLDEGLAMCCSK